MYPGTSFARMLSTFKPHLSGFRTEKNFAFYDASCVMTSGDVFGNDLACTPLSRSGNDLTCTPLSRSGSKSTVEVSSPPPALNAHERTASVC